MRVLKYLTLLVVLMCSIQAKADHLAGGYFEYHKISNTVYAIDFYFLRDCHGAEADNCELYLRSECGYACTYLGQMTRNESTAIDYGCGAICGPSSGGYEIIHFSMNVTLPTICDSWIASVAIIERDDVEFLENEGYYFNYCKINNSVDNSSPNVNGANLIAGCSTWGAHSLYTVTPTEGDQLVYDWVTPQNATNQFTLADFCYTYPVLYGAGLSPTMPFPATAPLTVQPDGSFSFVPTDNGTSQFALRVREYRNNVQIGEQVIEGMMYIEECESTNEVHFSSFPTSGNNVMAVSAVPGTFCQSVTIESDEPITNVWIEAPSYITFTTSNLGSEEVTVTLCATFPPNENFCSQLDISTVICAQSGDLGNCLAEENHVADRGYYIIRKLAGEYCPDNLFFTNRNNVSGIPMPAYSRAAERIWVGDSMPAIAPIQIQNDEGPIIHEGDVTLVAGIEVILPSCKDLTGDCVYLTGNKTITISPNSCSPDCVAIPLELFVREQFNCFHEQLQAEVEGSGPFTFQWIIEGDTITTSDSFLEVHDYVSDDSTGQIPYSCEVYDAVGGFGSFAGEILGTKSFYKPIQQHTIWFTYDPGDLFETGFYYAGQPGVDYNRPFFVADSVNSYGPWYGATYMKIDIWDAGGGGQQLVYHVDRNLEGGDDWSFNNGEFYWNGYWWNNQNNPCTSGAVDVLNYTLLAKNCLTPVHQEISALLVNACFEGNWTVQETKSTFNEDYYQELTGETREIDPGAPITTNDDLFVYPNPTDGRIYLKSSTEGFLVVSIIDASGKSVLFLEKVNNQSHIDVSSLSAGFYTLIVAGSDGVEKRLKLVKK